MVLFLSSVCSSPVDRKNHLPDGEKKRKERRFLAPRPAASKAQQDQNIQWALLSSFGPTNELNCYHQPYEQPTYLVASYCTRR